MVRIKINKNRAWITFVIENAKDINSAKIAGSWNKWELEPMKKRRNGSFSITKILPSNSTYEFKYLIDEEWMIDNDVKKAINEYGTFNSIIEVRDE